MDEPTLTHEQHQSRWMTAVTCSALVLLVVTGGVFALRDQMIQQSQKDMRAAAVAREKLAARIDVLQSTVDSSVSQPQADAAGLHALTAKIDALNARIDALEKAAAEKAVEVPVVVAPPPAPSAVAAASAPVAPATAPSGDRLNALKLAALSGKPFAVELAAWVQQHPDAEKQLAGLGDVAASGIASEPELTRKLMDVLDSQTTVAVVDDTSTVGKINTHLKGLVSIKKKAAVDPYAALRNDVKREDVVTLMQKVERLNAADRAPLEEWLKLAKQREAARETLAKLTPAVEQ